MRRLWLGLIVFKRLELPVPDTVSSEKGKNIMLSILLKIIEFSFNLLKFLIILIYRKEIEIYFDFSRLWQLAT